MEKLLELLNNLNIPYKRYDHPPVFTVEESRQYDSKIEGMHCKNFFLKDKKGKYFLFSCPAEKKINMNILQKKIGSKRLSFASPERLDEVLKLKPGSVCPFGIINDKKNIVTVIIDKELYSYPAINFHPLKNTSSITISYDDLIKFINHSGNVFMEVDLNE